MILFWRNLTRAGGGSSTRSRPQPARSSCRGWAACSRRPRPSRPLFLLDQQIYWCTQALDVVIGDLRVVKLGSISWNWFTHRLVSPRGVSWKPAYVGLLTRRTTREITLLKYVPSPLVCPISLFSHLLRPNFQALLRLSTLARISTSSASWSKHSKQLIRCSAACQVRYGGTELK